MENICIVDSETTGLHPSSSQIIEVAAVLYNIPTRSILMQASTLLESDSNAAYEINRIDPQALKRLPMPLTPVMISTISLMLLHADALIAHNAEFDKKFFLTIPAFQDATQNKKWICTRNDVTWPIRKGVLLNLVHICVDLGVPIVNAHRALSDCLLLLNAIECVDDIETFLDKSGAGKALYHANIGYNERQLAKDEGFTWDNIKKTWIRRLTPEEASKLPFKVFPADSSLLS